MAFLTPKIALLVSEFGVRLPCSRQRRADLGSFLTANFLFACLFFFFLLRISLDSVS